MQETATNNVNLVPTDLRTADLISQITPGLTVRERGEHTRIDGFVSIPILLYARTGSENNNIAPSANLLGDVNFFNRVLHVEGAVTVSQQFFNPFGAQPQDLGNATENRYRSTTYRVSPYLQGVAGDGIAYELRNNNVWTNLSGAPISVSDANYTEFIANAETTGDRLLGWGARYYYSDVRFNEQSPIITQLARLTADYGLNAQFRVRASVGYEDNQYTLTSSNGPIYGVGFRWRPTDRTDVVGSWEHRFFGSSYLFTFAHRTPLTVWNVQASRNITTAPQQLGTLAGGSDVAGYLNQLFLSNIPDAAARQQAVDQFLRDRGLPQTLAGPVTLYTEQILLQQQQSATIGVIGARNSIFLNVFNVWSEPITAAGNPLPPSILGGSANTQTGGSISWNNRLTQAVNLLTTVSATRTTANAPATGYTNQGIAQIALSMPFSARTTGLIGARYQALTSDVTSGYNEAAVFIGITYVLR